MKDVKYPDAKYDTIVDTAAPMPPKAGISTRLIATFTTTPIVVTIGAYRCKPITASQRCRAKFIAMAIQLQA
jgi:hypothetical protein